MLGVRDLVQDLVNQDDRKAYFCLKQLEDESDYSAKVYPFFDFFAGMLKDKNSYIRTRGIILIAANAKWDVDFKIDAIIYEYLKHITDEKPITARQCIRVLPSIVTYKPDLKKDIEDALHHADLSKYKNNMRSLIYKDIQKSLDEISKGF